MPDGQVSQCHQAIHYDESCMSHAATTNAYAAAMYIGKHSGLPMRSSG